MAIPAHAEFVAQIESGAIGRDEALVIIGARIKNTVREITRITEACKLLDETLYNDMRLLALGLVGSVHDSWSTALTSARGTDKADAEPSEQSREEYLETLSEREWLQEMTEGSWS